MNKMGRHLRKITAILASAAMIMGQAGMSVSAAEIDLDSCQQKQTEP